MGPIGRESGCWEQLMEINVCVCVCVGVCVAGGGQGQGKVALGLMDNSGLVQEAGETTCSGPAQVAGTWLSTVCPRHLPRG